MRLAPCTLAGLVIGLLLSAGPAAAGAATLVPDLAQRDHDPVHWVWGVTAPLVDALARKVTDPLAHPETLGRESGGEVTPA